VTTIDALEPLKADYLTTRWSIRSWLLSVDHKRIAMLYLISITGYFFIGGSNSSHPRPILSPATSTTGCSRCTAW